MSRFLFSAKQLKQRLFTLSGNKMMNEVGKRIVPPRVAQPSCNQAAAEDDGYAGMMRPEIADHREGAQSLAEIAEGKADVPVIFLLLEFFESVAEIGKKDIRLEIFGGLSQVGGVER